MGGSPFHQHRRHAGTPTGYIGCARRALEGERALDQPLTEHALATRHVDDRCVGSQLRQTGFDEHLLQHDQHREQRECHPRLAVEPPRGWAVSADIPSSGRAALSLESARTREYGRRRSVARRMIARQYVGERAGRHESRAFGERKWAAGSHKVSSAPEPRHGWKCKSRTKLQRVFTILRLTEDRGPEDRILTHVADPQLCHASRSLGSDERRET